MAYYEYQCDDCKKMFTVSSLISEHDKLEKQPECPECDGRNVRQLPSSFFARTSSKS